MPSSGGKQMDWLYTLSGFAVGAIVGLTGVGGGSLMTPLLVLVFGVAPVTAVGTDLLFAALTKTGGAWAHARRGNVDWKIVGWLAAARIVGADIAHAVPLTLVAGLGHAAAGAVDWQLLVALLIGSLPGIWLGSALSQRIPERLLRTALAGMLVLIGGKLAF